MATRSLESLFEKGEDVEPPDRNLVITDAYICNLKADRTFAVTHLKPGPGNKPNTNYMASCDFGKIIPNETLLEQLALYSDVYNKGGIVNPVTLTAKKYNIKRNGNGNSTIIPHISGVSRVDPVKE